MLQTETPTNIPEIELEYAVQIRVNFKERIRYETPAGKRVYVPADSGEIWGPRLSGIVVPRSGGDYADVYGLNAHYMLQADDGSYIYLHNRGHLYRTDGQETPVDDPTWGGDAEHYFRICPTFDAPIGPHAWLNRTLIIGTGQREQQPNDHTIFTYYAVK
jgi:hypothetical protein